MVDTLQQEFSTLHLEYTKKTEQFHNSFLKLGNTGTDDTLPENLIEGVLECEDRLQTVIDKIEDHQKIVTRIDGLQGEIERVRTTVKQIVNDLDESKTKLDKLIQSSKRFLNIYKTGVGCKELLDYAQRVAKHTLDPLQPPIPQENVIRMSRLFEKDVIETKNVEPLNIDMDVEVELISTSEQQDENEDEQLLDLDLF